MKKHIAISALGPDRPGLLRDLSKTVSEAGCNITDSRITVLGQECALSLLASGTWNAVAKLESQLPAIGKRLALEIHAHRTEERAARRDRLPYVIDVAALDEPGMLHELADFLAARNVNIEDMSTWTYDATNTGAEMVSVSMNVAVPSDLPIGRLRDDFTDLCDSLNIDATLEPARR